MEQDGQVLHLVLNTGNRHPDLLLTPRLSSLMIDIQGGTRNTLHPGFIHPPWLPPRLLLVAWGNSATEPTVQHPLGMGTPKKQREAAMVFRGFKDNCGVEECLIHPEAHSPCEGCTKPPTPECGLRFSLAEPVSLSEGSWLCSVDTAVLDVFREPGWSWRDGFSLLCAVSSVSGKQTGRQLLGSCARVDPYPSFLP